MPHSLSPAAFDALVRVNQDDICDALGVRRNNALLDALFWPPARGFAHLVDRFDAEVGAHGLAAGAAWLVRQVTRAVQVAGRANIPASGPALILANHPGLADTIALFAALPRTDLRVIAAVRPFLRTLPNVSRALIYVPDAEAERLTVVRQAAAHLRAGGAALTFPAGEIEPDPALMGEAETVASLENWSPSIAVFARLAPQTAIIPAIVSGVLSPAAQHHPLTRLRRLPKDRERFGAMLQVMFPFFQNVTVRVAFGPPLAASDLLAAHPDPAALTRGVAAAARHLIEQPPTEWETIVRGQR